MVFARKHELFRRYRRDLIWKLVQQMCVALQWCEDPEPYRIALFWLDVADKTWGWASYRT